MPLYREPLDEALNRIIDFGDEQRQITGMSEIIDIVSERISPDFGNVLEVIFGEMAAKANEAYYLALTDDRAIQGENEYQRDKLNEIKDSITDYLTALDAGKQKFSRQRVRPILENIVRICDENT